MTIAYATAVFATEKIDGFGFDGLIYGGWAQTFPTPLFEKKIDRYGIQRVVPSAIVATTLRLLHIEPTVLNVTRGFEGWAVLLVCACARVWVALARRLKLSMAGTWYGAAALFGSYATLKWTAFYPVLTDLWSVALALLQLLLFIDRRRLPLVLTIFVGAFTWPTGAQIGALLTVFLPFAKGDVPSPRERAHPALRWTATGLATVGWVLLAAWTLKTGYVLGYGSEDIATSVIRLSFLAAAACVFASASVLADDRALYSPRLLGRYVQRPHALLAAGALAAATLLHRHFAPTPSPHPTVEMLQQTAFTALQKPAGFVVAHVAFFGPTTMVLLLRWRAVMRLARAWGPGLVLLAGVGTIMFLNSESRHSWNVVVMFLPFAVKLLDERVADRRLLAQLAALTLVSSNVWLTIEGPTWPDPQHFPAQFFFMTDGPWMSLPMYGVQGLAVLVLAAWLGRRLERPAATRPLADDLVTWARPSTRPLALTTHGDPRDSAP